MKHRIGIGFEPKAPTGLIEHSSYGQIMENAFQNKFTNKIFDILIKLSTSDRVLNILNNISRSKIIKLLKFMIDNLSVLIDKMVFYEREGAKNLFLGKINGKRYRSAIGGFILELAGKYIRDWAKRQKNKIKIMPPMRKLEPLEKTYIGWKKLRDEIQPNWNIFPKNPKKEIVKIFPQDSMTPLERIERIIEGKDTDRVGLGLSWNWGIPVMGGSNFWKFCYDGIETGWAAVNVWIRTGGSDFLPSSFGIGAYTIPFPDAHSRFFFNWNYPSDNVYPQFIEKEILKLYDDLYNHGIVGLTLEISKRMIRDTFIMIREFTYLSKVNKYYFGPYENQFFPNPSILFAAWDILPMWRSLIPFSKDIIKNPDAIIEALEFLNKPLTDFMIKLGKLTNAKVAMIGNSRGSNTFISPEKFETIFWPSMEYTFQQCFKNDIIPLCHLDNDWTQNMVILAEKLPKRSCIFHLDQVDLVKVHDLIGDHFCLMGGMSPGLLVRSSPNKIEEAAKRYIENIGMDGLIISSGCEFPANTPIQNIYALKHAIKKYGFFKS
ncbi:MAG: uroporphyrinogen decarboxylase family protein [Candidatus Helarchaeota archaeon]